MVTGKGAGRGERRRRQPMDRGRREAAGPRAAAGGWGRGRAPRRSLGAVTWAAGGRAQRGRGDRGSQHVRAAGGARSARTGGGGGRRRPARGGPRLRPSQAPPHLGRAPQGRLRAGTPGDAGVGLPTGREGSGPAAGQGGAGRDRAGPGREGEGAERSGWAWARRACAAAEGSGGWRRRPSPWGRSGGRQGLLRARPRGAGSRRAGPAFASSHRGRKEGRRPR